MLHESGVSIDKRSPLMHDNWTLHPAKRGNIQARHKKDKHGLCISKTQQVIKTCYSFPLCPWFPGHSVSIAFLKIVFCFGPCSTGFDMIQRPRTPARMRRPAPGKFPFFQSALNKEQSFVKRP